MVVIVYKQPVIMSIWVCIDSASIVLESTTDKALGFATRIVRALNSSRDKNNEIFMLGFRTTAYLNCMQQLRLGDGTYCTISAWVWLYIPMPFVWTNCCHQREKATFCLEESFYRDFIASHWNERWNDIQSRRRRMLLILHFKAYRRSWGTTRGL